MRKAPLFIHINYTVILFTLHNWPTNFLHDWPTNYLLIGRQTFYMIGRQTIYFTTFVHLAFFSRRKTTKIIFREKREIYGWRCVLFMRKAPLFIHINYTVILFTLHNWPTNFLHDWPKNYLLYDFCTFGFF